MDLLERVIDHFVRSIEIKQQAMQPLAPKIVQASERIAHCLGYEGKVLACGNGGSAAEAQYFSAKMLNRFELARPGLPAIALTTDTSTLTFIGNDYGFTEIFSKQIQALGRGGDILLAVSTSGNSPNMVAAVQTAQRQGLVTVALTGRDGGLIASLLGEHDVEIRIPADSIVRIQEVHILAIHCICDLVDQLLFGKERI